jgi:endonuclease/exonuclease/phosphatase family metal-dependent hydrolase
MTDKLTVVTLNCWNISEPFEARMKLIRTELQRLQPDLIGLQEIIVREDGFDQAKLLLDGLGYHWTYGPAMRWGSDGTPLPWDARGDAFGNVVASRWPIRWSRVQALPGVESGERRSAVAAWIESPAGTIAFVSTHFNWKFHHGAVRERQAVALGDFVWEVAQGATIPPIVVGDLNAEPDAAEVRYLCGLQSMQGRATYFQDAWRVSGNPGPGFTWDNRNGFAAYAHEPNRRIDYILVGLPDPNNGSGQIRSVQLAFDQAENGVFPSDHFGLLAELKV